MSRLRFAYAAIAAACLTAASASTAVGEQSPFGDVSELCVETYDDFETVLAAFQARGWQEQDHSSASEDILDLMMFAIFFGADPSWPATKEEYLEQFKERRSHALKDLGFETTHRTILFRPDQPDVSSLILAFDNRGPHSNLVMCNMASSIKDEAAWLDKLGEDGKLPEAFMTFDPGDLNTAMAVPYHKRLTATSRETQQSLLIKFSTERVAPMLPRPMSHDLFISVINARLGKR